MTYLVVGSVIAFLIHSLLAMVAFWESNKPWIKLNVAGQLTLLTYPFYVTFCLVFWTWAYLEG